MTPNSWLRKRPLNQTNNESFHNLQQDHRFHHQSSNNNESSKDLGDNNPDYTRSTSPSKPLNQKPLRALSLFSSQSSPSLNTSLPTTTSSVSNNGGCDTIDHCVLNCYANSTNTNSPSSSYWKKNQQSKSKSNPRIFAYNLLLAKMKIQEWNDRARQASTRYDHIFRKIQQCLYQIWKWNDRLKRKSSRYECIFNKTKYFLCTRFHVLGEITLKLLISVKGCTCKHKLMIIFTTIFYASNYIYFVKLPIWNYEEEWTAWELGMQQSVANLIPPLRLPDPDNTNYNNNNNKNAQQTEEIYWHSKSDYLEQFPYLRQQPMVNIPHYFSGKGAESVAWDGSDGGTHGPSEYVVPVPDYELMGRTRGKLAQTLQGHAIHSCEHYKQQQQYHQQQHDDDDDDDDDNSNQRMHYSLPVIGITVANDTPENRYLRRLLHTIDLTTVGSIVVTWYDEQTEAQIVGKKEERVVGSSHDVIESTLREFIARRGFREISWDDEEFVDNATTTADGVNESVEEERTDEATFSRRTQLANATSLKLMSRIASSIRQFCLFEDDQSEVRRDRSKPSTNKATKPTSCRNELLILRFSTNLGCSTGVNNPLFTHPTAPHWLIVNYDIAYPPGVLDAMGKELEKTRIQRPDLAVHTYGYIYGRGKLENPWSNFVMTSCAVANVGVWDEDIFPAYYEDDDYRDRIRYIMGKWVDVVGDPDRYGDVPQYFMDDTHLIRYQTERHVAVAHGPLNANTYLSGTHETMKKVEKDEKEHNVLGSLWLWIRGRKPENPLHYESQRWNVIRTVSKTKDFFWCKHGALPDSGEHGEDSVRYFGWDERFFSPFVNRTRVSRLAESMMQLDEVDGTRRRYGDHVGTSNTSPWAVWHFNATRRKCVHEAANLILSMPPSEERDDITEQFRALCGVCESPA